MATHAHRPLLNELPPSLIGVMRWRRNSEKQPPEYATEFERVAAEIGVSEQYYEFSDPLRLWVRRHKNSRYVPEWLLDKWGMEVLCNIGD